MYVEVRGPCTEAVNRRYPYSDTRARLQSGATPRSFFGPQSWMPPVPKDQRQISNIHTTAFAKENTSNDMNYSPVRRSLLRLVQCCFQWRKDVAIFKKSPKQPSRSFLWRWRSTRETGSVKHGTRSLVTMDVARYKNIHLSATSNNLTDQSITVMISQT